MKLLLMNSYVLLSFFQLINLVLSFCMVLLFLPSLYTIPVLLATACGFSAPNPYVYVTSHRLAPFLPPPWLGWEGLGSTHKLVLIYLNLVSMWVEGSSNLFVHMELLFWSIYLL